MPEISFKTAEIHSQLPAREKISWELGSQVTEENPALARTAFTVSETYFVSSLDLKTAEKCPVD